MGNGRCAVADRLIITGSLARCQTGPLAFDHRTGRHVGQTGCKQGCFGMSGPTGADRLCGGGCGFGQRHVSTQRAGRQREGASHG